MTSTHTEKSKSGRFKTLLLIIGVLVALVIGLSVTSTAFSEPVLSPTEVSGEGSSVVTIIKIGYTTFSEILSI